MHTLLVDAAVFHALFKSCTGQRARVVNAIKKGINLDGRLGGRGQSAFGALTLCAQAAQSTLVAGKVLTTIFALEVLHAEINDPVVEVLTAQVSVSGCCFHFEDTILNGKERHIESTATHVVDEYVLLATSLLVQSVGNGCCCWFVDDAKHIQATDLACIFGCLTLGVVEVGWHSHNGIVDLSAQVSFGSLLHLDKNHGGDLLGMELLLLTTRLDNPM